MSTGTLDEEKGEERSTTARNIIPLPDRGGAREGSPAAEHRQHEGPSSSGGGEGHHQQQQGGAGGAGAGAPQGDPEPEPEPGAGAGAEADSSCSSYSSSYSSSLTPSSSSSSVSSYSSLESGAGVEKSGGNHNDGRKKQNKKKKREENRHMKHSGGPSKSVRWCWGRFVTGPDRMAFWGCIMLHAVPGALFCARILPYVVKNLSVLPVFLFAVELPTTLASAFFCSLSNPGIIPRGRAEMEIDKDGHEVDLKNVTIVDFTATLKYCRTCKIFRPPRASHCSECNNCVERFDHHCPWMGNCIGKGNYRYFLAFLLMSTLTCASGFAFCIWLLVDLTMFYKAEETSNLKAFFQAAAKYPDALVLSLFVFFVVWSVASLGCYHANLSWTGKTTNEDLKETFDGVNKNPYNKGGLKNLISRLFPPLYYPPRNNTSTAWNSQSLSLTETEPLL